MEEGTKSGAFMISSYNSIQKVCITARSLADWRLSLNCGIVSSCVRNRSIERPEVTWGVDPVTHERKDMVRKCVMKEKKQWTVRSYVLELLFADKLIHK